MKKFMIKATALAIGALVGSGAFAAVTAPVDLADDTTVVTFAKELSYVTATPLNPTATPTVLSFNTPLGFGVAANSTRYIRVDLGNAKFHAALSNVLGTDIEVGTLSTGNSSVAISAGGGAGDSYVIFAVAVAGSDVSQAANATVKMLVPSLRVTSTASPVTATYQLHESGASAVAGASGAALLNTSTGTLVKFATGLNFVVDTSPTTTASVEKAFKEFKTGGGYVAVDTAKLGSVTFGVSSAKKHTGGALALSDLVAAGTKLELLGDVSIPAGSTDTAKKSSVFLSSDAACGGVGTAATAVPTAAGAAFATGTAAVTTKGICYVVNGEAAIPASTYKVSPVVVAASGTATTSPGEKSIGLIDRDGTELQAPFVTIHPDYLARVVLTSQHSADAAVTASTILEDGSACVGGTTAFTLKAGKQLFINAKDICPSLTVTTGGTTRAAVKLIIAAPKSKVEGVFNMMNYDQVTGKTSSLSAYPMLRPTAN